MLALTENAVAVIKNLTEQPAVPDGSGLRIASGTTSPDTTEQAPEDAQALTLAVETQPQEGDQVLDAGGARLFLEPGAAQYLDDKALDAGVDDSGNVNFQVGLQPE
ncbi:MAG: adhesin [Actinocatenispora sp.]